MVGGWRMPTGKFNTHDYLAARQGEKKRVTTKKKDPHIICPPADNM